MSLTISDLIVTQDHIRNVGQLKNMIIFVKTGNKFQEKIILSRFPDSKIYIQDGHHRLCAMFLSKKYTIESNEYTIKDWKYEDYLDINFEQGWITPYHPYKEIRIPNLTDYKNNVYSYKFDTEKIKFINDTKFMYTKTRSIWSVQDLINNLFIESLL